MQTKKIEMKYFNRRLRHKRYVENRHRFVTLKMKKGKVTD